MLNDKGTLYAVSSGTQPGIYDIYQKAQDAGAWQQSAGSCEKFKSTGGQVYRERERERAT